MDVAAPSSMMIWRYWMACYGSCALTVPGLICRIGTRHIRRAFIRSDNGVEFFATAVMKWLWVQNFGPDYIKTGSLWQNGKLPNKCLNLHWFGILEDAKAIIEAWCTDYNGSRPTPLSMTCRRPNLRAGRGVQPRLRFNQRRKLTLGLVLKIQVDHALDDLSQC
jgi:hypothetical protein